MSEDAALTAREIRVAVGRLSRQLRRLYGQGQARTYAQGHGHEPGPGDGTGHGHEPGPGDETSQGYGPTQGRDRYQGPGRDHEAAHAQAREQGHGEVSGQSPARGQALGGPSFLELAVLLRLDRMGPCSAGALAAGERVTSQAVSAALAGLRRRGLVRVTTDPADRRRSVVGISDAGRDTLDSRERQLGDRLTEVVAASFTAAELRTLRAAAPLLDRLADVL